MGLLTDGITYKSEKSNLINAHAQSRGPVIKVSLYADFNTLMCTAQETVPKNCCYSIAFRCE